MTWFKVDDSLAFHPKFLVIGLAAAGLWLRAGAWCGQQLTDGRVPTAIPYALGASDVEVDALVDAGLWDVVEGGWQFHDWRFYQPSREETEAARAAKVAAGRLGGKASGAARRAAQEGSNNEARAEADAKQLLHENEAGAHSASEPPSRPVPSRTTSLARGARSTDSEPPGFAEWYAAYPKKVARGGASKAFKTALKKTDADTLLRAVKNADFNPDPQYVANPATWLNQERWLDERPRRGQGPQDQTFDFHRNLKGA